LFGAGTLPVLHQRIMAQRRPLPDKTSYGWREAAVNHDTIADKYTGPKALIANMEMRRIVVAKNIRTAIPRK
jgi:hypothetical protein